MVTITEAARLTGLTVKAIRHYEAIGLCVPLSRSKAGYRLYSPEDIRRLRKIEYFRHLKFPLREIPQLLDASPEALHKALEQQRRNIEDSLSAYMQTLSALEDALDAGPPQFLCVPQQKVGRVAVIGIDLQNDILEGGALPCKRILDILPPLSRLFAQARSLSIPVIYICDSHRPGDSELLLWNDHMMEGTWGAQIIDTVSPSSKDIILKKGFFNGFTKTPLQNILERLDVHTLVMTGWRTDICVAQTAIEAFYRGYRVVIAKDGVASTTHNEHQSGLSMLQVNYGFEMYPCEQVLEILLGSEEDGS